MTVSHVTDGQWHHGGASHPHWAGAGVGAQHPPDRRDVQRRPQRPLQPPAPNSQQTVCRKGSSESAESRVLWGTIPLYLVPWDERNFCMGTLPLKGFLQVLGKLSALVEVICTFFFHVHKRRPFFLYRWPGFLVTHKICISSHTHTADTQTQVPWRNDMCEWSRGWGITSNVKKGDWIKWTRSVSLQNSIQIVVLCA